MNPLDALATIAAVEFAAIVTDMLFDQLGPAKVVRLWSALQVGKGDYLRFRETHFAGEDVASLTAKIEAFEAEER